MGLLETYRLKSGTQVANTLSYFSDEIGRKFLEINGAGSRIRTDDLLITNQLLYQLSYAGFSLGE